MQANSPTNRLRSILLRRVALRVLVFLLPLAMLWSCGGEEEMGPEMPVTIRLSINFDLGGPLAPDAIELGSVRVRLSRPGGGAALIDTTITLPDGTDVTEPVEVQVQVLDDVTTLVLELTFFDESGQAVFRNEPAQITVRRAGASTIPTQRLTYVGPGVNAAGVTIAPASAVLFFGTTTAFQATATDGDGAVIPNVPFVWGTTADPATVSVADNGEVTAGSTAGEAEIVATILSTDISATITALVRPLPSSLEVVGGADQTGPTGSQLPQPVAVRVLDADGQGIDGVDVVFTPSADGQFDQEKVTTDETGRAEASWTLGTEPGAQTATISLPAAEEVAATVNATAHGEPANLEATDGAGQTGIVGQTLSEPLVVRVTDEAGIPVSGQQVMFVVTGGDGSVSPVTSETGADGVAQATWTLGTSTTGEQSVEAQIPNGTASPGTANAGTRAVDPVVFSATAVHDAPAALVLSAQPTTVTAGNAFAVEVRSVDQFDNVTTGAATTDVMLSIQAGSGAAGATLGGTNPVATANGIAAFADLTIDVAGTGFILEAAATGLTTATSSAIDVDVGGLATITVTPSGTSVDALGKTVSFTAVGRDASGNVLPEPTFTWTSSTEAVATVNAQGVATAVGNGSTEISATSGSVTGTADLTVAQALGSIVVTPGSATLTTIGAMQQFSAEARDPNDNPLVTQPTFLWTEDSEGAVATVDATGLATAQGNGGVEITATSGVVSGSAQLTVNQTAATIVVTPGDVTLNAFGATQQFAAEARDGNGTPLAVQPAFTWTENSSGSVATINANGVATARGNGSTTITATGGGASGTADLTVSQTAASIVVTPGDVTLSAIDDSQQFAAEARDANDNPLAVQPAFTWSESSSGAVATIDAIGLALATGNGATEITATGGGTSGTADLTVAQTASSIVVNPSDATLLSIGVTQQFSAEARDANDNVLVVQPAFTWTENSSGAVATIDVNGLATSQGTGVAEITASGGGASGIADLTVTQMAAAIVVTPGDVTLDAFGATQQFTAEARDGNGTPLVVQPPFTWSENSTGAVATIDASGLATAQGNGATVITAMGAGASGTADLTVAQVATSVVVTPGDVTLNAIDDTQQFTAEARDANDFPLTVQPAFSWSENSSGAVATINADGLATAEDNGDAIITAMGGGASGTADLTVAQVAASVMVTPGEVTLDAIDDTQQFAAEARDSNDNPLAVQPAFTWSENTSGAVATINASGLATAEGDGAAIITAMGGGASGTADLTVAQVATSIVVTPGDVTLDAIDNTQQFAAEARDSNDNPLAVQPAFTWSENTSGAVATINASGLATAEGNGDAIITAMGGGASGAADLTVAQATAQIAVTFNPASPLDAIGATTTVSAEAQDANGNALETQPASFDWESLTPAVADVSTASGATTTATASTNGTTDITAMADGVTGMATLTVQQAAASIVVTPGDVTLNAIDDTQQFAAEARDANDNPLTVQPAFTWSENSSGAVATIDNAGLATAEGNGDAIITAMGGGASGTADLTVTQVSTQIVVTFNPASALDAFGATTTASAEAQDANGNALETQPASFDWESLTPAVATLDPATGATTTVTAVTNGPSDITATADGVTGMATITVAQVISQIEVTFNPASPLDAFGATTTVSAEAQDANGNALETQPASFEWESLTPATATVDPAAGATTTATAVGNGTTDITATSGGVTGMATLTVAQVTTEVVVSFNPPGPLMTVGATTTASAEARDANGNALVPQPASFDWQSLNTPVATVNPAAGATTVATAVSGGSADIEATVDGVSGTAELTVAGVTISWAAPVNGDWDVPGNWNPAQVPMDLDDVVIDMAGGSFTVNLNVDATVANLIVGGESGDQTLSMTGRTLTVNGDLDVASTGTVVAENSTITAALNNEGQVTFTGGGTSTLGGSNRTHVNNERILVDNTNLILSLDGSTFNNTDRINGAGTLTINQTGLNPSFTTSGTITMGISSTFTINGGTFNYDAGTLTTSGFGTLNLNGVMATFTPAYNTNTSQYQLTLTNGTTLAGAGMFTNGTDQILTIDNSIVSAPLTNIATVLVHGTSTISGTFVTGASSTLRIEGISAAATSELTVTGGWTNTGIVELTNADASPRIAQLTVTGGPFVNTSMNVNANAGTGGGARVIAAELDNQGTINVNSELEVNAVSATHTNSGTFVLNNGDLTLTLDASSFANTGALAGTGNVVINQSGLSPSFTTSGAIGLGFGSTMIVTNGTFNYTAGTLSSSGGTTLTMDAVTAAFTPAFDTAANGIRLTLQAGTVLNGPGAITNGAEQLLVLDNSTINTNLDNQEVLQVGGTSTVSGTTTTNASSGTITGTGTLDVSGTTFTNQGTIAPAENAVGTLTIDDALTQSNTSVISVGIGGVVAGVDYDVLAVNGPAHLDGSLVGTQLNGFVPTLGTIYTVMTFTSHTGPGFQNPTVTIGGVVLTIQINPTNVRLLAPSP